MKLRSGIFVALLVIVSITGCNSNITNPQSSLNPGGFSVDFPNGSEFLSSGAKVADQSSAYIITATQDVQGAPQDEMYLSIPENPNGAPYTVQASDGAIVQYYDISSNSTYEANAAQGSCTINVTQISPTFQGTFTAATVCNDTVLKLINGSFNANY
jgi:hypothetical protein